VEYLYLVIIVIGIYVILASSFNFVIGYGGLLSIAHPAFFAIGAYVAGILARDLGWSGFVTIPIGALAALSCSIAVSLPALRVSGDYLIIASIGFQLGLIEVLKNLKITGGAGGLSDIPAFLSPQIGSGGYAALVVATAVLVVLLLRYVAHSAYGRAITAMRDDEVAYAALGRSPMWLKLWVLALGSGIAGFAGGIYALYFRYVSPEQFDIMQSNIILTMVMVGGMRTTWGPVVGAVLLEILPQAITFLNLPPNLLGPLQGIIFTSLVLIFMFVRPSGLVSAGQYWRGSDHGAARRAP
jgi:branched-chain amino acid transport system permease protein